MIYQHCLLDLGEDYMSIIDACLQVIFDVEEWELVKGFAGDLAKGETLGVEVAAIYFDDDVDDGWPEFTGVCFSYFEDKIVVDRQKAEAILRCVLDKIGYTEKWGGLPESTKLGTKGDGGMCATNTKR